MGKKIHVIGSHTTGEPSRVVLDHNLAFGNGSMSERPLRFRADCE